MASSYDRARRQQVDPNKVRPRRNFNEKAVERYRQGGKADGAEPFVVIDKNGNGSWANGAHRAEAARRDGKQVTARVHDVRVSGAVVAGSEGCMVALVGLFGVAAVLVGLIGRRR